MAATDVTYMEKVKRIAYSREIDLSPLQLVFKQREECAKQYNYKFGKGGK